MRELFENALEQIKTAAILLCILSLLTGIVYPLLVMTLAKVLFPYQADGSLILRGGKVVGSKFIGQYFTNEKYFWGRLSATIPYPYNALQSGGSNLSVLNPKLIASLANGINLLNQADPKNQKLIPVDLVTTSASGLDPEISLYAAYYQAPRIATARGISTADVEVLIAKTVKWRSLGLLGEPRVNVLLLNLALDDMQYVTSRRNL